jgi:hypothetical protein
LKFAKYEGLLRWGYFILCACMIRILFPKEFLPCKTHFLAKNAGKTWLQWKGLYKLSG